MQNYENAIVTIGIFGLCAVSTFFLMALWGFIEYKLNERDKRK